MIIIDDSLAKQNSPFTIYHSLLVFFQFRSIVFIGDHLYIKKNSLRSKIDNSPFTFLPFCAIDLKSYLCKNFGFQRIGNNRELGETPKLSPQL